MLEEENAEKMPPRVQEVAKKALEALAAQDAEYYKKLTEEYGLNAEAVAQYAWKFYQESYYLDEKPENARGRAKALVSEELLAQPRKKNKYLNFDDFLNKHFSSPSKPGEPKGDGLENYIQYLIKEQKYAVSTIDAGSDNPFLGLMLGIYRHGYITIYDSPFKNDKSTKTHKADNHEILELNPGSRTNESTGKKVTSQVRFVPGIVTMALHLSGRERLDSGEYALKHYRPWVNDCQTYFKHTQEGMNELLDEPLKQKVIDHFRYRPEMAEQQVQWLIRQEGKHLDPDALSKMFRVGRKGLEVVGGVTPETKENFRNRKEDRLKGDSPKIKDLPSYYVWVVGTQFIRSILDRAKEHIKYEKAKYDTKGAARAVITQLAKQNGFIHEMGNVLFFDSLNMADKTMPAPPSDLLENIQASCCSIQRKGLVLSALLSAVNKSKAGPFDHQRDMKIDRAIQEINREYDKLINEIADLRASDYGRHCNPQYQRNMENAIKDLRKHKKTLNKKIEPVLNIGVMHKETPKQAGEVQKLGAKIRDLHDQLHHHHVQKQKHGASHSSTSHKHGHPRVYHHSFQHHVQKQKHGSLHSGSGHKHEPSAKSVDHHREDPTKTKKKRQ